LAELKLLTQISLGVPKKCWQFVVVDKTTKHMQYLRVEMNKLTNYGIEDGSTVYLILRLHGGGTGGGSFALESMESQSAKTRHVWCVGADFK